MCAKETAPQANVPGKTTYTLGQRALIRLIRWYQVMPRPRGHCRFIPTCSAYAVEAVELHGLMRGLWLALKRLGRCRPFGGHGFDPVPIPNHLTGKTL